MPIFDMIENIAVRKGLSNGFLMRTVYRSIYVSFTAFVAITLPVRPGAQGLVNRVQHIN